MDGRIWCPNMTFFFLLGKERLKATKDHSSGWLEKCFIESYCTLFTVKRFEIIPGLLNFPFAMFMWPQSEPWSPRSGHEHTKYLCHSYTTSELKGMQVLTQPVFLRTRPAHSNVQTTRLIGTTHFILIVWHTFSNSLIKALIRPGVCLSLLVLSNGQNEFVVCQTHHALIVKQSTYEAFRMSLHGMQGRGDQITLHKEM
jgi:hypothetical protein